MKKLSQAIALAGVMTAAAVPAVQAEVEVSASAGLSTGNLLKGKDLASQSTLFSADLSASMGGGYATLWVASADEYDVVLGYGGEAGDVSFDLSLAGYAYPNAGGSAEEDMEAVAMVGFADASLKVSTAVDADKDAGFTYFAVGYDINAVSLTYGLKDEEAKDADYSHLDLSYAFNDQLSFTFSKIVTQEKKDTLNDDLKIVASYSLPIEL